VLRSPIYAHHIPYEPSPDEEYAFIDQGIQQFHYAMLPHEGTWVDAQTVRRAAELNCRPVALAETYHEGPLPQTDAFVEVSRDNVIVSAIKKAEDSDDLIIRCYESAKKATDAEIILPKWNRTIKASFQPGKSRRSGCRKNAELPVRETNLLEWDEV